MKHGPHDYTFALDGVPRYKGKGRGKRTGEHFTSARTYCRTGKVPRGENPRFIRALAKAKSVIIARNFVHDSDTSALAAERAGIKHYGRLNLGTGPLFNFTDGGDYNPMDDERVRERHRYIMKTDEYRANLRAAMESPDYRANRLAMLKDPEYHRKLRETKLGDQNPMKRPDVAAKHFATAQSPGYKAKQSTVQRVRWQDPACREKRCAGMRGKPKSEEHKMKLSAATLAYWQCRKALAAASD